MVRPRARDYVLPLMVLLAALLACKENAGATKACATAGNADSKSCEQCCKSNGANGYKYVGNACSCLGN